MSKFPGLNQFCMVDKDSKKGGCADKNNNVQTTCKRVKEVSQDTKTPSTSGGSSIMKDVRDVNIDYNYFRASQ